MVDAVHGTMKLTCRVATTEGEENRLATSLAVRDTLLDDRAASQHTAQRLAIGVGNVLASASISWKLLAWQSQRGSEGLAEVCVGICGVVLGEAIDKRNVDDVYTGVHAGLHERLLVSALTPVDGNIALSRCGGGKKASSDGRVCEDRRHDYGITQISTVRFVMKGRLKASKDRDERTQRMDASKCLLLV